MTEEKPIKATPIINNFIGDTAKNIRRSAWIALIESLLTLTFGIIIILDPVGTLSLIIYIISFILILRGLYVTILYFINDGTRDLLNNSLLSGIISVILGLILLTSGLEIAVFFRIIIGIWIIYDSLTRLNLSIKLHSLNIKSWPTLLTFSLIMLILGFILVFVPGSTLSLLGYLIATSGLFGIIGDIIFLLRLKEFTEKFSHFSK